MAGTFQVPPGPWQLFANGFMERLILEVDENGKLTGTIEGKGGTQQLAGFWDANSYKITFLRMFDPTKPSAVQVYTGYYSITDELDTVINEQLMGTYQDFSSGNTPERLEFGWAAFLHPVRIGPL